MVTKRYDLNDFRLQCLKKTFHYKFIKINKRITYILYYLYFGILYNGSSHVVWIIPVLWSEKITKEYYKKQIGKKIQ